MALLHPIPQLRPPHLHFATIWMMTTHLFDSDTTLVAFLHPSLPTFFFCFSVFEPTPFITPPPAPPQCTFSLSPMSDERCIVHYCDIERGIH